RPNLRAGERGAAGDGALAGRAGADLSQAALAAIERAAAAVGDLAALRAHAVAVDGRAGRRRRLVGRDAAREVEEHELQHVLLGGERAGAALAGEVDARVRRRVGDVEVAE